MNAHTTPFVLLVGSDLSPASHAAVVAAARMAERFGPSAEVHVAHVHELPHGVDRVLDAVGTTRTQPVTDALRASAQFETYMRGVANDVSVPLHAHGLVGHAAESLVELAESLHAGLLFVGASTKPGEKRGLLNRVSEAVGRTCPCPLVVVRMPEAEASPRIDPPCPDCERVCAETQGATFWCERHGQRHPRARTHFRIPSGFGQGSQTLRGTP
jgi:nucleotide-binding universal stress UspA family protein